MDLAVSELKEKIQAATGVAAQDQELVFGSTVLEDGELKDYGMKAKGASMQPLSERKWAKGEGRRGREPHGGYSKRGGEGGVRGWRGGGEAQLQPSTAHVRIFRRTVRWVHRGQGRHV